MLIEFDIHHRLENCELGDIFSVRPHHGSCQTRGVVILLQANNKTGSQISLMQKLGPLPGLKAH